MSFRPNFNKGLILKQHMLEALRDYPYDFVSTFFGEMGDGIIVGLKVSVPDSEHFKVSGGIAKINGEIYFITKETILNFDYEKNFVYLETSHTPATDGTTIEAHIVQRKEENSSQFELFRYIRNATVKEYTDIKEIFTETINRIDQSFSAKSIVGGNTLCDEYYTMFAKYILNCQKASPHDISFAYQCLNGICTTEVIKMYFNTENIANANLIRYMKDKALILEQQTQGKRNIEPQRIPERKMTIS